MEFNNFVFVLEIIGIIALAITGALKAIDHEMDIFGVIVLSTITSLGGGFIRDILINRLPASLNYPEYFLAILFGGLLSILSMRMVTKYMLWVKVFDAIGLAIFSISGALVGIESNLNFISVLLLGSLSGIGGGVLRDVLANEVPLVFRQEIYALASITGIVVLWVTLKFFNNSSLAIISGSLVILVIRIFAIYFNLSLPNLRKTK